MPIEMARHLFSIILCRVGWSDGYTTGRMNVDMPSGEASGVNAKRVLVVEDDELFRRSLCTFVSALGYEPEAASSADEALRVISRNPVDLVLTDYHLQTSNGLDLIEALRASGPIVPSVLLSGYLSDDVHRRASHLHVDAVLRKPVDLEQLSGLIPSLLGETVS